MSDFQGMEELLQDFLVEAGDLLSGVDNKLVDLEQNPEDHALLNEIFRGFHTIKGGAGFLNATELVTLCHLTENLFDRLRNGELKISGELMDVIGTRHRAGDARTLVGIVEALAGKELRAAIGELDDRRRVEFLGGLHDCVDRAGVDDVDCRKGKLFFFGQTEDGLQLVARGDTCLDLCCTHDCIFQIRLIERVESEGKTGAEHARFGGSISGVQRLVKRRGLAARRGT